MPTGVFLVSVVRSPLENTCPGCRTYNNRGGTRRDAAPSSSFVFRHSLVPCLARGMPLRVRVIGTPRNRGIVLEKLDQQRQQQQARWEQGQQKERGGRGEDGEEEEEEEEWKKEGQSKKRGSSEEEQQRDTSWHREGRKKGEGATR